MVSVTKPKQSSPLARRTLAVCGGAHSLHDGFTDAIYVLLPIWSQALGLSLVQVGLLKSITSAALAGFQLPAGFLSERFGATVILALGTMVAGLGYILAGFAGGFVGLALALAVVGAGAAVQHPLSSALVADAYRDGGRRAALGIYNFTGDVGKMLLPTSVAVGIGFIGWQESSMAVGALGLVGGVLIWVLLHRLALSVAAAKTAAAKGATEPSKAEAPLRGWGIRDPLGFSLLSSIGLLDTATRYAF
ncbi:MAG: MFS transporter, partial [Rickettsiales bacterium]